MQFLVAVCFYLLSPPHFGKGTHVRYPVTRQALSGFYSLQGHTQTPQANETEGGIHRHRGAHR